MKILNNIPYEIRKENESFLEIEDVEKALKDAFYSSHVSIPKIVSVYIDNKYNPLRIEVSTYKNTAPLENDISVDYKNYKDGQGDNLKIIVSYIETEEVYNLVKHTCMKLELTYKQLAYQIGYSESNLNKVASTGQISNQLSKVIELYLRTLELEKELEKSNQIKTTLKEWLK